MMRDPMVLLKYECRRRPELARLVDDIDRLSQAEILAADVPLPWMRQALIHLKATRRVDAMITNGVVDGLSADPMGVMRQWQGDGIYIRIGRTELLMKSGQLIWLDQSGVWIDTLFTKHIDPKLHSHTVFRARMTRSEYNMAVREQARGSRCVLAEPMQEEVGRFRIYRPG